MIPVGAIARLVFKEIYRRKDFYVFFMLIVVVLFYVARMKIYNVENISRYVREVGLALIYLFSVLLTVPLAARQFSNESSEKTLGVLLAKPVSRFQVILGKFLGSFLAGLSCFFIFYLIFVCAGFGGVRWTHSDGLWQTGYLFGLTLMMLAAVCTAFSQYMTFGANVTFALIMYFVMTIYGEGLDIYALNAGGAAKVMGFLFYYLLPHFEFFDIRQRLIHDWDPLPWDLIGLMTAYALAVTGLFLLLGWLKFRRMAL